MKVPQWIPNFVAPFLEAGGCSNHFFGQVSHGVIQSKFPISETHQILDYYWVFLNSLNNPKFGASQNLKILIGIPPLDDPMTNLPKKNGWNSLQPPEMELQSLVPTESPSWHHISSRSPGHIHQRIWACHTSLERSRIAFYGYANLCPPNQTIWRLEASKAIQRCPWFAYIRRWDENFSHWVTSYTSLAFRKT